MTTVFLLLSDIRVVLFTLARNRLRLHMTSSISDQRLCGFFMCSQLGFLGWTHACNFARTFATLTNCRCYLAFAYRRTRFQEAPCVYAKLRRRYQIVLPLRLRVAQRLSLDVTCTLNSSYVGPRLWTRRGLRAATC